MNKKNYYFILFICSSIGLLGSVVIFIESFQQDDNIKILIRGIVLLLFIYFSISNGIRYNICRKLRRENNS
jgi:hypothetical protein